MTAPIILKAAMTAAVWHSDQRRKGEKAEPYVNHLIEVAQLVAEAEPGNTDLIVAALLHDSIEDQHKTRAEISDLFGDRVADLVEEVTDDKSLLKAERKRLQVENAPKKSREAKILKLADKTANLRALAASPPNDWPLERRREYIDWATSVIAGLKGVSPSLEGQFEEAREQAVRSLETAEARPPCPVIS